MKIKDIKVNDYIQTFDYINKKINLYQVINIYECEKKTRVFNCARVTFNEYKEIIYFEEHSKLIHENEVIGIFEVIEI